MAKEKPTNYHNLFQPSIIQFSDKEYPEVPYHLRGKFAYNINILTIKWFAENFLLVENPDNPSTFMYMLTHDNRPIALDLLSTQDKLDIPRAYVCLTQELIDSQEAFKDWLLACLSDVSVYITGTDEFKPGRDYYLNHTIYTYFYLEEEKLLQKNPEIHKFILPNYLDDEFKITKWFILLDDPKYSWNNPDHFFDKNQQKDFVFKEDDFRKFSATFYWLIQRYTKIHPNDKNVSPNNAYDIAMKYFINGKVDAASINLAIILGTKLNAPMPPTINGCACVSNASGVHMPNDSCFNIYNKAMIELSKQMLSSVEFYKDWFYMQKFDDKYIPNDVLIDYIVKFITEYMEFMPDMSLIEGKRIDSDHCCEITESDVRHYRNKKIFENYLKVMEIVRSGCLDQNRNKIKIWGAAFGELIALI